MLFPVYRSSVMYRTERYVFVAIFICPVFVSFCYFFFLMIRRPPRSTHCISSAASDVYKRQYQRRVHGPQEKNKREEKGVKKSMGESKKTRKQLMGERGKKKKAKIQRIKLKGRQREGTN
eukprot:TRINITY_DN37604_c0_g1_i1.p2 TRINITY_DN37604_c0_g1~~TRINITY_DN37604_c0_g1_i1.p2  ORF type:complete len:120 (-),score=34.61 TRINITY_DN37604_c0_g1_i1:215-574(-)